MKRILLPILVIAVLLLSACGAPAAEAPVPAPAETPSPEPVPAPMPTPTPTGELELELVETAPSLYQLDITPVYSGFQGESAQCYLGSFAMLAKYDDPALDFSDVVACCGVGTCAHISLTGGLGGFGTGPHGVIATAENLGYGFIIGVAENGRANDAQRSPEYSKFEDKAQRIEYFDTEDDAFNFLRRVIASNYPVMVVLDFFCVRDDLAKVSSDWSNWEKIPKIAHGSHHFTVTGYDPEYVYLNDPTGTDKAVNLPVAVINFESAWKVSKGLRLSDKGPYWMFFLVKKQNRKSASSILAWNKQISASAPSQIRKFAENPKMDDMQRFMVFHFIRGRSEYAKFLARNSKTEAAALYEQSSKLWLSLLESSNISDDLREIADLEEQAQGLY